MEKVDLTNLMYCGQYYHSITPVTCSLCEHEITTGDVYTLRSPHGSSLCIGDCCFTRFKKSSYLTYTRLCAAQVLLKASKDGFKNDVKVFNVKGDFSYRQSEWIKMKRRAIRHIREYHKTNKGGWLPKPLYELKVEVEKKPGKTSRWFDNHLVVLQNKLRTCKG